MRGVLLVIRCEQVQSGGSPRSAKSYFLAVFSLVHRFDESKL